MEYIATFFTQSGAIKYQRYLVSKNISAQIMPVPRKFSSSCGISVKFTMDDDVLKYISDDIDKIYEMSSSEGKLIYRAEI
ncbi:Protein of unknown function [Caloramator quimbayensis]|uniref:Putative Se/S carrier protein-like domain-containing protein n=1 Tax=Caloramator quimbayensis TaxID=1147123 RepID=A0A1T4XFE3_9CLOT|nr:DUF3343 domain-containing protein [Caloramator quimbayensis]SKA88107.1 Protein of unknown function [Caloramator quimbayensis]